ncbi:hypothetical protein EH138_14515 [Salmonella enterica subsp. enterica serovar Eastbourne]|uniref:Uncharacterized protein n=1 Tax=Salmonella enterica subsp. enterica serovar Eastbourne TaxID=486993 RepID=A0A702FE19_SALET|nr:hypothetical protein [Salmonella enterica subsp. enterica serovar Eastbourne]ECA1896473.1 hypothetical protein [Salmonella enterica subsp. enterica serovar Eastbourne]HAC6676366.1 hypothetical protein [Salmonella enterica subsp. enterica serovar Eastbourne]HAE5114740.1 hypothetical protein [Salmonella enterica subsp. enterica serovar Eastbourne]HAE8029060.1 hypothetical protein [Salmonella enterica subsp. enterica serovar Eastbourne]
MRKLSDEADATWHRERRESNDVFGFMEKKIYLGRDTRHKMALIALKMTGSTLGPDRMDSNKAADILSACVNHMYNSLFSDEECQTDSKLKENPKIVGANSPKAMEIYYIYQIVKGRFDKLYTGDTDKEKCASVAEKLIEMEIKKPKAKGLSKGKEWTREDVAWICSAENINYCIKLQNDKYVTNQQLPLENPKKKQLK